MDAAITLDIDWAPDFVIDHVAGRLIAAKTPATWFVTHASPAIERLRERADLFELGIHPNFLPGSTQGATPREVLRACLAMVPGATSMRTHGLVQSTPLLELIMAETPVRVDASVFLPHMPMVQPVEYWWQRRMLLRVPYIWEDDFEIERPAPNWTVEKMLAAPGVRVFDFHPIHVYLNSADLGAYTELKRRSPRIADAAPGQVDDLVRGAAGAGTAFDALTQAIGPAGRRMSDFIHGGRP